MEELERRRKGEKAKGRKETPSSSFALSPFRPFAPSVALVDSHAHLDDPRFADDRDAVIVRARASGVIIVTVGGDLASSEEAVSLAKRFDIVYACVGVHPHDARTVTPRVLDRLRCLVEQPKVVGIGEIGLDFYRDLSPRPLQEQALREQLRLAHAVGLPVVLHSRDAHGELLRVLREEGPPAGVFHCFSGDASVAARALELGFYISFAGSITYAKTVEVAEACRAVPDDRLLVETDAPYLTPVPWRGKRNEPAYVELVAAKVAEVRGTTLPVVASVTTANARSLFGLPEL